MARIAPATALLWALVSLPLCATTAYVARHGKVTGDTHSGYQFVSEFPLGNGSFVVQMVSGSAVNRPFVYMSSTQCDWVQSPVNPKLWFDDNCYQRWFVQATWSGRGFHIYEVDTVKEEIGVDTDLGL